jgi:uncharacterized protein YlxW (UPF0749 family)
MKKALLLIVVCFAGYSTFAQIERKKIADTNKIKGTGQNSEMDEQVAFSKKKDQLKLLKELNLTREQKGKLKEMRQANQSKRAAVMNDVSLTEAQRQAQLKALQLSGAVGLQGILNEAQKKKLKELRKERKNGNGGEMMLEE